MVAGVKLDIEVTGLRAMKRALKALEDNDAPFIREALDEGGRLLARAAAGAAPQGVSASVRFAGIKGRGVALRAVVDTGHVAAASFEFGRQAYPRPGVLIGNNRAGSKRPKGKFKGKFRSDRGLTTKHTPGYPERPYLDVKDGGGALDAVRPKVEQLLSDAFVAEFDRQVAKGDD